MLENCRSFASAVIVTPPVTSEMFTPMLAPSMFMSPPIFCAFRSPRRSCRSMLPFTFSSVMLPRELCSFRSPSRSRTSNSPRIVMRSSGAFLGSSTTSSTWFLCHLLPVKSTLITLSTVLTWGVSVALTSLALAWSSSRTVLLICTCSLLSDEGETLMVPRSTVIFNVEPAGKSLSKVSLKVNFGPFHQSFISSSPKSISSRMSRNPELWTKRFVPVAAKPTSVRNTSSTTPPPPMPGAGTPSRCAFKYSTSFTTPHTMKTAGQYSAKNCSAARGVTIPRMMASSPTPIKISMMGPNNERRGRTRILGLIGVLATVHLLIRHSSFLTGRRWYRWHLWPGLDLYVALIRSICLRQSQSTEHDEQYGERVTHVQPVSVIDPASGNVVQQQEYTEGEEHHRSGHAAQATTRAGTPGVFPSPHDEVCAHRHQQQGPKSPEEVEGEQSHVVQQEQHAQADEHDSRHGWLVALLREVVSLLKDRARRAAYSGCAQFTHHCADAKHVRQRLTVDARFRSLSRVDHHVQPEQEDEQTKEISPVSRHR